jgi:phosphoglycerate dehydrogenase-like enzyme
VESLTQPLRIALLDAARTQGARLTKLLDFPHEFVEAAERRQTVDAVVGFRFGRTEAERYLTSLVHLPGAGADAIDMDVLERNCAVCNVFEHEVPVAEFVLAAILDHAIGYTRMTRGFDSEKWSDAYFSRRPHVEISGKVLGLIGYGHIGKAVTQRASAFGMHVHAVSHSGRAPGAEWAADPSRLPELLAVADFLVIACPLTAQTRGLIGAKELDAMKRSAVLINIGRAQVVEEEALFRALEAGRLGGATLDVWYQYPTAGDLLARPSRFPFDRLPNVHCTAHSSAWTEEMFERRYAVIADNLTRLHGGKPLRNVIRAP